jgi:hypothetical protein
MSVYETRLGILVVSPHAREGNDDDNDKDKGEEEPAAGSMA